MKKLISIFLLIFTAIYITSCSSIAKDSNQTTSTTTSETNADQDTLIVDATKFSRITANELEEIMGTPSSIEDRSFGSPSGKEYPTKTYNYDNGSHYEFMVIDDAVVRFTYYSEKYNDIKGKSTPFSTKNVILSMFGITPSESIKTIADTGSALRYHLVSDRIADFWVLDIDNTANSFDTVKITYNLNYFE